MPLYIKPRVDYIVYLDILLIGGCRKKRDSIMKWTQTILDWIWTQLANFILRTVNR